MGEVYIVRDRLGAYSGSESQRNKYGEFIVAYVERAAAEADAAGRNRTWRRLVVTAKSLFGVGDWNPIESTTSLPEPVFRDWLQDHDIPLPGPVPPLPPAEDTRPWYRRWLEGPFEPPSPPGEWVYWWDTTLDGGKGLTAGQRDHLVEVLNKVGPYDVSAVPTDDDAAGATVFVVYENFTAGVLGLLYHDPVKAFPARAPAVAERKRLRAETGRRYGVVEVTRAGAGS